MNNVTIDKEVLKTKLKDNVAEAKLENTLGHFTDLHKTLVLKDNITLKLQDTNDQLMQKVSITMKTVGGTSINDVAGLGLVCVHPQILRKIYFAPTDFMEI